MIINEFDVVKLKDNNIGTILEIFENGDFFLIEIQTEEVTKDIKEIKKEDIEDVIYKSNN